MFIFVIILFSFDNSDSVYIYGWVCTEDKIYWLCLLVVFICLCLYTVGFLDSPPLALYLWSVEGEEYISNESMIGSYLPARTQIIKSLKPYVSHCTPFRIHGFSTGSCELLPEIF